MNFPEAVLQYASADVVADLSTAIGEPQEKISAALSAAIPAVLLMLTDKCSTPSGADIIFDTLGTRGPAMLERLPSSLASGGAYTLSEAGFRHLSGIAGRDSAIELSRAVAQFAAVSQASAHSLVGVAASIALAAVAKHIAPQDAHTLASNLNDQQEDIAAAMPAGILEYLDKSLNLHPIAHHYDGGWSATGTDDEMQDEAAIPRQENVHNERYYRVDRSERVPQELTWMVPILIVAAVIVITVLLLYPRSSQAPVTVSPGRGAPEEIAVPAAGAIRAGEGQFAPLNLPSDPELGRQFTSLLDSFARTLTGRDSPAQRQRDLAEQQRRLQELSMKVATLPPAEHRALARRINDQLPALERSAGQNPGRGEEAAQQTAGQIMRQLRSIAVEPS